MSGAAKPHRGRARTCRSGGVGCCARQLEDGIAFELFDVFRRLLKLRRELVQPLVGVRELRLRATEVRADQVEVLGELVEVVLEVGDIGKMRLSCAYWRSAPVLPHASS